MRRSFGKSNRGFTLLEVLIAMALGLLVIGVAVQLFSKSMDATNLAAQRAEMQQDVRAAQNVLVRDLSMAGAGLPPGGVALATGGAKNPIYGCDQVACYMGGSPPSGAAFPGGVSPYLYWIVPGKGLGATVTAPQGATDAISVVMADTVFPWSDYTVSINANGTGATFTLVASPPSPVVPVSSQAYGLKAGDLVLLTGTSGGNAVSAVAEVTADVGGAASPYTVNFSVPDALGFNQNTATSSSLTQMKGLAGVTATRILLVSYYISVATGTPTLMRQVNGHTPAPLAENIVDLRFNYDTYDDLGNLINTDSPVSPNLIRKVNLAHMTARSPVQGTKGYQSMDVQTSVSARNLSFKNRYN